MTRDATIRLDFGDGTYAFRLAIGGLRELQEKTGVSCFAVLQRLQMVMPLIDDAPEVLRIGLIGGGLEPLAALALMRRYCLDRPPAECLPTAIAVLQAALFGVPDEAPGNPRGKAPGATAAAPSPPMAASASQGSTA